MSLKPIYNRRASSGSFHRLVRRPDYWGEDNPCTMEKLMYLMYSRLTDFVRTIRAFWKLFLSPWRDHEARY
jgi:hypothetical protein